MKPSRVEAKTRLKYGMAGTLEEGFYLLLVYEFMLLMVLSYGLFSAPMTWGKVHIMVT